MDMNRKFIAGIAMVALLCIPGVLAAQSYTLSVVGPAQAAEGGTFQTTAELTFTGPDNMAGWSFGCCNDTGFVTLTGIADGSTTSTIKNGGAPDFNEKSTAAGGYTQGVVICFTGCSPLPPGSDYELIVADYTADLETPTTTQINYCDTLGNPPVATVVVVNGASIVPDLAGLDIAFVGVPDPAYTYLAPTVDQNYNPGTGTWSLTAGMIIDQDDNGAPDGITQGFSMGLSHDPAQVAVTAVAATLPFAPDFAEVNLGLADGWTIGCVYSFTGANTLVLQDFSVVDVDYENAAGAPLNGDTVGLSTPLTWSDNLGTPPVANVVVVGGGSLAANFANGAINLNPVTTNDFLRGDANDDSIVNIADGIWILNDLFQGGPTTTDTCPLANDANDDGLFDASDATYIFNYRFLNGPTPPAPFPACGQVAGQVPTDCTASSCP
jgi:hypothetical protein